MSSKLNLCGLVFTRLTVIKYVGNDKYNNALWKCKCICGNETNVSSNSLIRGNTKSCGCLRLLANNLTHNLSQNRFYKTWDSMIRRCYRRNCTQYKNYGGRGITVCDEWRTNPEGLKNFIQWCELQEHAGEKGYSLDRRDNDLGYSPDNCWFRTQSEQCRNMRSNKVIIYKGKKLVLADAIDKYSGVSSKIVRNRLDLGWSIDKSLETPLQ